MKDIVLKITGKTISAFPVNPDDPKNEKSTIEFMTAGKFSSRGGITRISYEETELSGMPGSKTQITISGDKLKLTRVGRGMNDTTMEFEQGKRYEGIYATPYGNIGMELLTNSIDAEDPSKKISIDYSLSLKGLVESHNSLEIEVLQ